MGHGKHTVEARGHLSLPFYPVGLKDGFQVINLRAVAFTKEPSGLLGLHVLISGLVYLCCVSNIQGCQRPSPASREGGRKGAGGNEESSEQSSQHILDSKLNITIVSITPLCPPKPPRSSEFIYIQAILELKFLETGIEMWMPCFKTIIFLAGNKNMSLLGRQR